MNNAAPGCVSGEVAWDPQNLQRGQSKPAGRGCVHAHQPGLQLGCSVLAALPSICPFCVFCSQVLLGRTDPSPTGFPWEQAVPVGFTTVVRC